MHSINYEDYKQYFDIPFIGSVYDSNFANFILIEKIPFLNEVVLKRVMKANWKLSPWKERIHMYEEILGFYSKFMDLTNSTDQKFVCPGTIPFMGQMDAVLIVHHWNKLNPEFLKEVKETYNQLHLLLNKRIKRMEKYREIPKANNYWCLGELSDLLSRFNVKKIECEIMQDSLNLLIGQIYTHLNEIRYVKKAIVGSKEILVGPGLKLTNKLNQKIRYGKISSSDIDSLPNASCLLDRLAFGKHPLLLETLEETKNPFDLAYEKENVLWIAKFLKNFEECYEKYLDMKSYHYDENKVKHENAAIERIRKIVERQIKLESTKEERREVSLKYLGIKWDGEKYSYR